MDREALRAAWQAEEERAFQGWDFSYLDGRTVEETLPWDYRELVLSHLKPQHRLLDMGTGGGEFLLSLGHPPEKTSVTEGYAPNLKLCRERLSPLGIQVKQVDEDDRLHFEDRSFDLIINRHKSFDADEVFRCLRPGGRFITQQVGDRNNRSLSERLIAGFVPGYPLHDLKHNAEILHRAGFDIELQAEAFTALRFLDVGAICYFARQLPWEFPGFSVDTNFEALIGCEQELECQGFVETEEHRFILCGKRPAQVSR